MERYSFKHISLNPSEINFPEDFPLMQERSGLPGSYECRTDTFLEMFLMHSGIAGVSGGDFEKGVSKALRETFKCLGKEYLDTDTLCTDVAMHGGLDDRILGGEKRSKTLKMQLSLHGYICYSLDRLIDAYSSSDFRRIWALHNDISLAKIFLSTNEELENKEWRDQSAVSERARNAAIARHSKPGGSHEMKAKIREIWASGKYTSRDRCAEEECSALGVGFRAARNALKGEPDPPRE